MAVERIDCDILVVGSGPGGATTACLLAEAGHDVLLVEEGGDYGLDSAEPYSMDEIDQKYRNAGLTPAFGPTTVTYIEGRCMGGGSEINAALCHWPMEETLERWKVLYQIDHFGPEVMQPIFDELRQDLGVTRLNHPPDPASMRLKQGADALGWASEEVERFWKYDRPEDPEDLGSRRSMTETLLPRAREAGCRFLPWTRIHRLGIRAGTAREARGRISPPDGPSRRVRIRFQRVVVCGGPVQTPALLSRSGLRGRVGHGFTLHPMVRAVACFDEVVNDPRHGVPVQQVVEFKPYLTLGCSHSSLPHLMMWMGEGEEEGPRLLEQWPHMAIFYVLVLGTGRGRVHDLPGLRDALVRYPLQNRDLALLGEGLYRLGQVLFEAGARSLVNPLVGGEPIEGAQDLHRVRTGIPHSGVTVSTIHLFGTCAMGEDPRRCAVDSFGRLRGCRNVLVNDASILPEGTGVNPQATLLAVARRNVRAWLEDGF